MLTAASKAAATGNAGDEDSDNGGGVTSHIDSSRYLN